MLARSEHATQRFYSMSAQIQEERNDDYKLLEATQKGDLDIAPWITWFLDRLGRAFEGAEAEFTAVLAKAQFWERHRAMSLNERQRMMVGKFLDGFNGSAPRYRKLDRTEHSEKGCRRRQKHQLLTSVLAKARDPTASRGMNARSLPETARMADSVLFRVELLTQNAESALAPGDPLSRGTMRVIMADVEIWNDAANLTSTALCLLRTTRGDFVGPIDGVSDTNPLIHHCGLLPEMGCPIGASWRVRHVGGDVHIDAIVRAREVGADVEIDDVATPLIIERAAYANQVRAFAIAVRDALECEPGRYTGATDPSLAPMFAAFWAEYTMLLSDRSLIATELTATRIEEALASPDYSAVEAVPGMFIIHVCDAEQSAAIVACADRALWKNATINADRSIDRSVRDAEVLDEAANADLVKDVRDLLLQATCELASDIVPGSVLEEVQVVRYHPGGHYLDHRDTPAIGATPRVLSLVWYLNDGFTGGETRFVNPDIIVSPVGGVAIAFSPVLMHRAEPIVAGTKYAVVAWYHQVRTVSDAG